MPVPNLSCQVRWGRARVVSMLVLFAALEFDLISKVLPCCNAVVSDHMTLCREERAAVRGGSCVPSAHGDKTPNLPLSIGASGLKTRARGPLPSVTHHPPVHPIRIRHGCRSLFKSSA